MLATKLTKDKPVQLELPFAVAPPPPGPVVQIVPRQAFFRDTGPFGTTCRQCLFWARRGEYAARGHIRPAPCRKFKRLTDRHGLRVSPDAPSCRYYTASDHVSAHFISPTKLGKG
jgi:hypothetical protein